MPDYYDQAIELSNKIFEEIQKADGLEKTSLLNEFALMRKHLFRIIHIVSKRLVS